MRKVFSLLLTLLLVTTVLSSVYHVAIDDSVYGQLYFQPMDEQPLNTFNNQPPQVELLPPQQTPIRKVLWTSASWSNGNERTLEPDQIDPYDSQFRRGSQGDRIWIIDGNGNAIIEQGGGSRAYILTKNKDVQLTVFVILNKSIRNIQLNVRTNHHIECGFGGYHGYFSIEEQSIYFKKEVVHPWYSPRLGMVSLKDAGLNEWKYDQKVGLRLEAKNIVADDGKEAVRISSYFNEAGDGNIWKKVTEWTDKQDGGISSGLAQKDFNTNFKEVQSCKGKGDNMVESKEKALAPFLGTADALWIRVNAVDSDGTTPNNILLSDIIVEDIGEEQTQIPPQQQPPQQQPPQQQPPQQQPPQQPLEMFNQPLETLNNQPLETLNNQPLETLNNQIPEQQLPQQPLETLNNQIPEQNFEPLVEAPKHNYGPKINNFLEELQASLLYQEN
jgi:hypothetical protein